MKKEERKWFGQEWVNYPLWANILLYIYVLYFAVTSFYPFLGWAIIFIITQPFFIEQAKKIKKSSLYPLFLVGLLSLIGYIIWYIYYRIKVKKKNKMKKQKIDLDKKNLLNKITGGILLALGFVFLISSLSTFGSEVSLFYPVINMLSSIALIFLGIYVFRVEKWAIILAGVYGIVLLISGWCFFGLFIGGFRSVLFDLAYLVLAINWWVSNKK